MPKKTYYPQKTFDDALVGLVELYTKNGWALVDVTQLAKDAQDQRAERTKHDTLQAQYLTEHEAFGVAQDERYQRFGAALNAARGAFRNDKAVMAALAPFKRAIMRKSPKEEPK